MSRRPQAAGGCASASEPRALTAPLPPRAPAPAAQPVTAPRFSSFPAAASAAGWSPPAPAALGRRQRSFPRLRGTGRCPRGGTVRRAT